MARTPSPPVRPSSATATRTCVATPHGPARRQPADPRLLRRHLRRPGNRTDLARFPFPDPASRRLHPDWEQAADVAGAILRTEAGRNPYDQELPGPRRGAVRRCPSAATGSAPAGHPRRPPSRHGHVRHHAPAPAPAPAPNASATTPSVTSLSPTKGWRRPPTPDTGGPRPGVTGSCRNGTRRLRRPTAAQLQP
ncbi:hypothetical protein [Streptomyces iconiensis]|uniref:MmyB family transcriptional regulator n=1 Tax=Streptomyces iconiensis TaxID=1384038 RepID=UPI003D2F7FE0